MSLRAPFPYFGGKSKVASVVWDRFGSVRNYVEPFAGSCAVLLARPHPQYSVLAYDGDPNYWGTETINDADGLVSNFWRALQADPDGLIDAANWPVNEADLHARHLWLVREKDDLTSRLMADPAWYDIKAAGYWVWGACAWIGQGWCRGDGCWTEINGEFVNKNDNDIGVNRQIPHIGDGGRGINRRIPFVEPGSAQIQHHIEKISDRLRSVRVACGDWSRVTGYSSTHRLGVTGVFLDPPYSEGTVDYNKGDRTLSSDVRDWCIENGDQPKMRIALCGYEGEHTMLEQQGWTTLDWKTGGGYGNQGSGQGKKNAFRERIWFSPHCKQPLSANIDFLDFISS